MKNKYEHNQHITKQKVIKLLFQALQLHYKYSYLMGKIEYCTINDAIIIDYNEFKDILKNSNFGWCNFSRHLSIDLSKINKIYVY